MKIKNNQLNNSKIKNNHDKIKIKNLISFNNIKNPFKDSKESEKFFKSIIEEEMNLSNTYNSENLNKLLNLYFKGLNLYQNTPNLDKVNAFTEKAQLLLQSPQSKKILNQNKKTNMEINEIKTDSTLNDENEESENNKEEENDSYNDDNKLKFDFKKYKTIRHNEIQNRNKLNYLSNSIKRGIKDKNIQKRKINEINKEFNKIKDQQIKTSIFLEDEIKKQTNNFKEKLNRKRTLVNNRNKKIKKPINAIKEEKNENNDKNLENEKQEKNKSINKIIKITRNKTPFNSRYIYNERFDKLNYVNKKKRNSFSFFIKNNKDKTIINNKNINNKNDIDNKKKKDVKEKLKKEIYKYIQEYNNEIYKYYI